MMNKVVKRWHSSPLRPCRWSNHHVLPLYSQGQENRNVGNVLDLNLLPSNFTYYLLEQLKINAKKVRITYPKRLVRRSILRSAESTMAAASAPAETAHGRFALKRRMRMASVGP